MNIRQIKIMVFMLFLCAGHGAAAQTELLHTKNLQIGDTLPDIVVNKIMGDVNKTPHISELHRQGLLIINFWATWCAPCLKELKLLDSLAGRYNDDLKVLSVTYQKQDLVSEFFKRRKQAPANILIVTDDTLLHNYFKHRIIPHNIWVDKKGIIVAITGEDEITGENISAFLENHPPDLHLKIDNLRFDSRKPYHVEDSLLLYRSIFARYNDHITSGILFNNLSTEGKRFFGWNRPIVHFFWLAYTQQAYQHINWNLVELHTKDSVKFLFPSQNRELFSRSKYNNGDDFEIQRHHWEQDNLFCYDLILPKKVSNEVISKYMFQDLERFFNIIPTIEKRKISCKVITFKGNNSILSHSNDSLATFSFKDSKLIIKNLTIEQIFQRLYDAYDAYGVDLYLNETGINYPIDLTIDFPKNLQNVSFPRILLSLEKLGFEFTKANRFYPILVLHDLN